MARRRGGAVTRVLQEVEQRTGLTVERAARVQRLEESARHSKTLQRTLEDLGYAVLETGGVVDTVMTVEERRSLVQQARTVWRKDPQAGGAVDLMNAFVWGRGAPKPKAKDPAVQDVIDRFWDDPANQRILTGHAAQMKLGVDLALQSNLFILVFDDGEDGRVRVSLVSHDAVENVVVHPDDRFNHLWFVARERRYDWDFEHDSPAPMSTREAFDKGKRKVVYYEHWQNYRQAVEDYEADLDGGVEGAEAPPKPPDEKIADGRVFHISVNSTTEDVFGHPEFDRLLRWFRAYNAFMESRVDVMRAAAAFVMKRKVTGSKAQVEKAAVRGIAVARQPVDADMDVPRGPDPAGVLTENQTSTMEPFRLPSGAGDAAQDASQLRAQVSAGTGLPPTYFGDLSSGNLATATSLELPVLKRVEIRQELFEQLIRFCVDRAIKRAVEVGELDQYADRLGSDIEDTDRAPLGEAEDQAADEERTERDLSYEFSLPNPLRRAMTDLVAAVQNTAKTFDPNNTNMDLSRILLTLVLSDGFEVQDAAEMVRQIFPPGYVDPAVAAAAAQASGAPAPGEETLQDGSEGGFAGADGDRHTEANPYGAPMQSGAPEDVMESRFWPRDRNGDPVDLGVIVEAWSANSPARRTAADARADHVDDVFGEARGDIDAALAELGV